MTDIPADTMSETAFPSLALAQKNSQKKQGFRKRLLDTCQEEFYNAVVSVSYRNLLSKIRIISYYTQFCRVFSELYIL